MTEIMASNDKEARRLAFILELNELTRKHGVSVCGCGCCGSPWLNEDADVSDERAGYGETVSGLRWIAPSDEYSWTQYSAGIIRR